ncbi:MAG: hypothetical protein AB7J40_03380 [Candidatus Altimarinota bacterium]
MLRFVRFLLKTFLPVFVVLQIFVMPVFAQSFSDIFNLNNSPVNYDSPYQIGRGFKDADSIDSCMLHREFNFNEVHNVWVEGLVRCKYNAKRVLSKATSQGVSTDPVDEQACSGKREGQIIVQGTPSETQARRWSERCSYLGALGGAGPVQNQTNTNTSQQYFNLTNTSPGTPRVAQPNQQADPATGPVYSGTGVQVPSENLIPQGISRRRSLSELIIFYTNVTLPYVSVISVLAFVGAGLFYILSFANEELSGKAKNMMTYVVIGIIIIFSAYTIVNTLLNFITFEQ